MDSSQVSPCVDNSRSASLTDAALYSDDFEMTDSAQVSPNTFLPDPSPSISGRIPTPIRSSFSPFAHFEKSSLGDADFADDEGIMQRMRRGRRLPSPISEGETSPSVIVEGLGDMQMEVETTLQEEARDTPVKKGHTRSKHSLRNWTGFGGELSGNGAGAKRFFSMGYRSDCEKCRMKVPGHFSHIITYD